MPLTPEQINAIRAQDKLAPIEQVSNPVNNIDRGAELEAAWGTARKEERKAIRSLSEKVLDFTGGKEIAQGLGQALNMGAASKQLEDTQKMQFDLQGQLLQKIKEGKAQGQDVSRLEKALGYMTEDIDATAYGAERLLNPNELTTKQVVGDALQLATTAGAGTALKPVSKLATGGTGIVSGALKGTAAGAVSRAATGGAYGVAEGLQEDKDTQEVINTGLKGAAIGGVAGGVLGGLTGAVSGGIKGSRIKKENQYLDAITPETKDLPVAEYEKLVTRGKIAPKAGTSPDRYILSPEEIATAEKYKSLLGKDPVKNTKNLISEVAKNDKSVETFLKSKNGIFNTGELKNSLTSKLQDIDDLTVDEARLVKLKESTIDNFLKSLKKNDMETLWKARKQFDQKIESAFTGSPTLQKEIKVAFRNAVQDFISERTDDVTYKGYMKEMSNLYNLIDTTSTKAAKERGINAVQAWIKSNPGKAKIVGWGGGAAGLTMLGINN